MSATAIEDDDDVQLLPPLTDEERWQLIAGTHGTISCYAHGPCRCSLCVAARAAYDATPAWERKRRALAVARGAEDTSWMDDGACADSTRAERRKFFNVTLQSGAVADAKAVCATCPVQPQCEDYGRTYGEIGVWGGIHHLERRACDTDIDMENDL